jgi:hypothetical protein
MDGTIIELGPVVIVHIRGAERLDVDNLGSDVHRAQNN